MASIAANPFLPAAGAPSANASNGASSGNGAGAASGAQDASGSFMQLVNGMIQGNTTADQLPANLAAFLLTGDEAALQGIESELSANDDDDDADVSELDGLGIAALLTGLQSLQPTPAGKAGGGTDALGAIDLSGRGADAQSMIESAALTAVVEDATAEAFSTAMAGDGANAGNPTTAAAPLQNLLQAHKAAEAAPQSASAEVRTPVGAQGWSDEIGTHLTMMAANGREAASLRLSPEHLGPLEIRISMKEGEASVVFGASNNDTRNALEQSLPRLREMFASQGLVLGDASVSRDSPRDTFKPATFADASRGSSDAGADADVTSVTRSRLGLVDTYV